MSMTCTIYKCDCPNNVLNKTDYLEDAVVLSSFSPYEPLDDLHGYIIIEGVNSGASHAGHDYVKITNFAGVARYYFVTSRELMTANRCKMNLEEDALMTWHTDIGTTPCIIGRSGVGGFKDMGNDIPTMSYSIIADDSQSPMEYGTLNELKYVVFSACSGDMAIITEDNRDLLPDERKSAGVYGGDPRSVNRQ